MTALGIVVLILVIIVHEYFRTIFVLQLKKHNLNIWEKLGRPSGYFSSYIFKANGFAVERYIYKKEYTELGSSLRLIGNRLYTVQIVYFFVVAIFIFIIVLQLFIFLLSKG